MLSFNNHLSLVNVTHRLLQHLDSCGCVVRNDPQVVREDIRLETDAQPHCCSH